MIIALILVLLLALAYGALQGLLGHGPFRFLNTMYLKSLPGNAEIYRPEDLKEAKTEAALKTQGKIRVEGKEYVMQDGDVVNFRFNV